MIEQPAPKRKRPAPVGIRIGEEERAEWTRAAAGMPLQRFIINCVRFCLGRPSVLAQRLLTDDDHRALTKAQAALGQGRIASNLNQIAKAVNNGSLYLTPEEATEVREACRTVAVIGAIFLKVGKAMRWRS